MFNRFSAFEQDFAGWRRDGYPDVNPETYQHIDSLSGSEAVRRAYCYSESQANPRLGLTLQSVSLGNRLSQLAGKAGPTRPARSRTTWAGRGCGRARSK